MNRSLMERVSRLEDSLAELTRRVAGLQGGVSDVIDEAVGSEAAVATEDVAELLAAALESRAESHCRAMLITGGFLNLPASSGKAVGPKWLSVAELDTDVQLRSFVNRQPAARLAALLTHFGTEAKIEILRTLILDGPLTQAALLEKAGVSQGQFYHHAKDLIAAGLMERERQDSYRISLRGRLLCLNVLGAVNAFEGMVRDGESS